MIAPKANHKVQCSNFKVQMKKEDFLNKLRKNTHVQFDMPAVDVKGIQYEDTLKQFIEMTESVGGHVIEAKEGESLDELVKKAYPEAKVFASHLPEITIAQKNPDTVAEANDLNGTDVGIVRGEVGVAENGCIWIPQTMKEKAVLFHLGIPCDIPRKREDCEQYA